ncbi:hypothetical protein R3W88_020376 [Solanum pinnatisectum]|uniref:Secreted protein n=1 Tax=Solanum pinnatisectum TaxID=50273 RepID=A0AAV9KPD7_9SOLN|nr:hypothetical protein R3W88_020376 [Solanum pinnatisectum]
MKTLIHLIYVTLSLLIPSLFSCNGCGPVIADQHAAVNMYPGPVHTARHTLGIGFARSIRPMITHDFCGTLVPQRPFVVLLVHTTVGSSTEVKL